MHGSLCLAVLRPSYRILMTDRSAFQPIAFAQNLVLRGFMGALLFIPYHWRVPLGGWFVSRALAPIAGWRDRVRKNLALILPDLPQSEVERLARAVPDAAGRTLIEVNSGAEFKAHVANCPIKGAGLTDILAARARGQGVILVSGHFGNYDVMRAVLSAKGYPVAAFYKPFSNPYFNTYYVRMIESVGAPIFAQTRSGMAAMVRHLRAGGMMGILIDQHSEHGAALSFFGHRALTGLSAAEMALKYNCLLIPVYGLRLPDGLNFELIVEDPVPHSTPQIMTQALNDSLETIARPHLDQYFLIHRRWK